MSEFSNVQTQQCTCLCVASRTFSNLPLSGNTPYLSRPITPTPAIARDLAESPSVRINVHEWEFLVPASLASSSFGMPFSFECFDEWHFWLSCAWALNFIHDWMLSTMPHLFTCVTYEKCVSHTCKQTDKSFVQKFPPLKERIYFRN